MCVIGLRRRDLMYCMKKACTSEEKSSSSIHKTTRTKKLKQDITETLKKILNQVLSKNLKMTLLRHQLLQS